MLAQRPHNIGLAPTQEQGARITVPLLLTSMFLANNVPFGSVATADLTMEDAEGAINNIQTMYVDASLCPSAMLLYFPESQQTVWIAAKSQGYYPIAVGSQGQIQAKNFVPGGAGYTISIQFLNVPVPPCVWSTRDNWHGFVAQGFIAGNTAGSISTNNNTAIPVGYNMLIDGVDVTGNGATVASDIVVTLGVVVAGLGPTVTMNWDVAVPVIGTGVVTNFSRKFDPPLCTAGGNGLATLSVPAMGAGNTISRCAIYWHIN